MSCEDTQNGRVALPASTLQGASMGLEEMGRYSFRPLAQFGQHRLLDLSKRIGVWTGPFVPQPAGDGRRRARHAPGPRRRRCRSGRPRASRRVGAPAHSCASTSCLAGVRLRGYRQPDAGSVRRTRGGGRARSSINRISPGEEPAPLRSEDHSPSPRGGHRQRWLWSSTFLGACGGCVQRTLVRIMK
jgi:hypothetical protein